MTMDYFIKEFDVEKYIEQEEENRYLSDLDQIEQEMQVDD